LRSDAVNDLVDHLVASFDAYIADPGVTVTAHEGVEAAVLFHLTIVENLLLTHPPTEMTEDEARARVAMAFAEALLNRRFTVVIGGESGK
tara:strand:- start:795 stop:1064 length:270 start_codon:yes stop_codon:yes gene_type:complete